MDSTQCPSDDELHSLLAEEDADPLRSELELHLDHCPICQDRLARAAGPLEIPAVGPLLDPAPAVVESVRREESTLLGERTVASALGPSIAAVLKLLDPSTDPNRLGLLGPYEIKQIIGQGGMGVVLSALDTKLQRDVAIKIPQQQPQRLDDEEAQRFLREAQALAALRHENIVLMYTIDEFKGVTFHVMELIEGESVSDRLAKLEREQRLAWPEVLQIGMGVASALAAAHECGIIHRDIKPANVLIDDRKGTVKVADFGLAKNAQDASLTNPSMIMGTPEYMSPEQVTGAPISPQTDLFSLGVLLYRLGSNRSPFRRGSTIATLNAVCRFHPQTLTALVPETPEWFSKLVERLLAKKPQQRPESAALVLESLRNHSADSLSPDREESPSLPVGQPAGRRTVPRLIPWLVLAILVLLMAGGAFYIDSARNRSDRASESARASDPSLLPFRVQATGHSFAALDLALEQLPADSLAEESVILVEADGPIEVSSLQLGKRRLTLKAGEGFRPIFVPTTDDARPSKPWIDTSGPLELEGIEVRWPMDGKTYDRIDHAWDQSVIRVDEAELSLKRCRILSAMGCAVAVKHGSLSIRHSHLVADQSANVVWLPSQADSLDLANNLLESENTNLLFNGSATLQAAVPCRMRLSDNYFFSPRAISAVLELPQLKFALASSGNLFDCDQLLCASPGESQVRRLMTERQRRRMVARLFELEDQDNLFRAETLFATCSRLGSEEIVDTIASSFDDWQRLWEMDETTSAVAAIPDSRPRDTSATNSTPQGSNRFSLMHALEFARTSFREDQVGPEYQPSAADR